MTEDICGHATNDGGVCEFTPSYSDGRCGHHTTAHQTPHNQTLLEQHPEIADLVAEEIGNDATVIEALAEVEEKMGVSIAQSTHENWMAKGKQDNSNQIFKEYRSGVRRARTLSCRSDRQQIKQKCLEKGDTRTLYEMHKEMYGGMYNNSAETEDTTPPFAVPEELIEEWQEHQPPQ